MDTPQASPGISNSFDSRHGKARLTLSAVVCLPR